MALASTAWRSATDRAFQSAWARRARSSAAAISLWLASGPFHIDSPIDRRAAFQGLAHDPPQLQRGGKSRPSRTVAQAAAFRRSGILGHCLRDRVKVRHGLDTTQDRPTFIACRRAARRYDSPLPAVVRRFLLLYGREKYSPNEIYLWGLLDPSLDDRDLAEYVSNERLHELQATFNPRDHDFMLEDKAAFQAIGQARGLALPALYGACSMAASAGTAPAGSCPVRMIGNDSSSSCPMKTSWSSRAKASTAGTSTSCGVALTD